MSANILVFPVAKKPALVFMEDGVDKFSIDCEDLIDVALGVVTVEAFMEANPNGRDAIKAAFNQLVDDYSQ